MKKSTYISIVIVVIVIIVGLYYWFFLRNVGGSAQNPKPESIIQGFNPFSRNTIIVTNNNSNNTKASTTNNIPISNNEPLAKLRKISETPVGGMSASSTVLRYVDRGLGHVFEIGATSTESEKISNTTIPRVYESYWNKNLNQVVFRYIKADSDNVVNFFGEIKSTKNASSSQDTTRYEIKGKFLSNTISQIAVSPKGDRIFTLNIEGGNGIGYISNFDETKRVKLFDTPMTQVKVEWPVEGFITLTTRASSASLGYMYIVDTKTGYISKILTGSNGFSAKPSLDLKKIVYSKAINNSVKTYIYDISKGNTVETVFNTLPEKCVWSNNRKNEAYCAVPTSFKDGIYPDDWYKGNVSFIDQIWHINTDTGEVHMLANPLVVSDVMIDAINLKLDPKENNLYFINKYDLSLWVLDLNK
jgi:hypothetical protein